MPCSFREAKKAYDRRRNGLDDRAAWHSGFALAAKGIRLTSLDRNEAGGGNAADQLSGMDVVLARRSLQARDIGEPSPLWLKFFLPPVRIADFV